MGTPFKTVAVCGPTASGKSALSIVLAQRLHGEVVNVDSVQVYQGLDIGSAKLTEQERQGVPHHVLDVFSPQRGANVAEFRDRALDAIRDISGRGALPLLVGGSGMYFTILLHGLAPVPNTPDEVRAAIGMMSSEEMYAELSLVDPVTAARLNVNDRQRVSRALEIARVSGRKPSELFAEHTFSTVDVVSLILVLCRPRDELYRRINQRSQIMVEQGLVQETASILAAYGRVPPLETIGYKQACQLLEGAISEEMLAAEISLHTRRFAKRQMSYWRNEPPKRGWVVRPRDDESGEDVSGFDEASPRAQKKMKSFRAFRVSEEELIQRVAQRLQEPLDRTEVWYVALRE
jgi:tRNA dimethylallyltransferase